MRSFFEAGEVNKVVVKLKDDSTWAAEYNTAGQLIPIRQIEEPPKPEPAPTPTPGAGSDKITAEEYITATWTSSPGTIYMPFEQEYKLDDIAAPMPDSVFRARLSNVMTDNMFDRRVKGRTRGRLDMTRLWKAQVRATNLFTQKQARKNKAYNIVLLVDESGSMNGEKINKASGIARFLAKTFDGLNLNLAIVGFNQYLTLHKGFDEKIPDLSVLQRVMRKNASSGRYGARRNNDYEALAYSYELFKGRTGQNFLIMLSDGQPEPSSGVLEALEKPGWLERSIAAGDSEVVGPKDEMGKVPTTWVDTGSHLDFHDRQQQRHLNHLVEANGNVASIGIGLDSDCWQIPNNIREDDMDKLKPVLLKEIQKEVKRG